MIMTDYHIPVLLEESIRGLITNPDGVYVDLTFGGGGHSSAILDNLSEYGRLVAFDQDEDAWDNSLTDARFSLEKINFKFAKNALRYQGLLPVDGVLADLGVSSHQFDELDRGFSFRGEAPLDMRMDRSLAITAEHIVNQYSEKELVEVLRSFGEVSRAHRLVSKIVAKRKNQPIKSTGQLEELVRASYPFKQQKKEVVKVFQALRIEVNQEMEALKIFLRQASDLIKPGGRLVVISYHSLEDRLVKNMLRTGNLEGEQEKDFYGKLLIPFKPLKSKPITPSEEEIARNPRARSAKLRIAERI